MTKSIRKKIQDLKKQIRHHDQLYYTLDQPEITDYEYDQLFQSLLDLERQNPKLKTKNSPTQKMPGQALDQFKKEAHSLPMLSLQNSYSTEEIQAFYNRLLKLLDTKQLTCFVEPKLDGVAVELVYERGKLTKALTRGDGKTGENITENIKTLRGLPLTLGNGKNSPSFWEVRGEVLILKKDFERINREQEQQGLPPFANPRNLTAGSLRQLDPKVTAERPIHCFIHSPGKLQSDLIQSQKEFMEFLPTLSLPAFRICRSKKLKPPLELCRLTQSAEEIIGYYRQMLKIRHQLPFETDGIVVKVNDFHQQKILGAVARNPRWAIAGKFPPEQGQTQVLDIRLQVGRTGVITPVAVLNPIFLGGVSIRQASLHNFQDLNKKDIRVGDAVVIQRAGDVIPEVIKPLKTKRNGRQKAFAPPENCPVCQNTLKKHGDYILCPNTKCPAVRENKLIHFASKSAMNIEFLGEKSLKKFYEWGWLKSYSDIYDLKDRPLKEKEGFGKKSHELLIKSLEKSKKTELSRLIFALGISLVGEQTAQKISDKIYEKHGGGDLDIAQAIPLLQNITQEELENVEDVGPLVAQSFLTAFQDKDLIQDLQKLNEHGLHFAKRESSGSGVLKGMFFVITGTLPQPRGQVQKKIESHGGKVQNQVSRKTNWLLLGENPGSKEEKVRQFKVKTLNWKDFLKMI